LTGSQEFFRRKFFACQHILQTEKRGFKGTSQFPINVFNSVMFAENSELMFISYSAEHKMIKLDLIFLPDPIFKV